MIVELSSAVVKWLPMKCTALPKQSFGVLSQEVAVLLVCLQISLGQVVRIGEESGETGKEGKVGSGRHWEVDMEVIVCTRFHCPFLQTPCLFCLPGIEPDKV